MSETPTSQRRAILKPFEHYVSKAANRDAATAASYASDGYSQEEIGRHFGLSYFGGSRIVKRAKTRPDSAAAKAAERMPNAEVKHYPVGHFDVYRGEARVQSIDDQLYFLARFFR